MSEAAAPEAALDGDSSCDSENAELVLKGRSLQVLFAAPEGLSCPTGVLDGDDDARADAESTVIDLSRPVKTIAAVRTSVRLDLLVPDGCTTLRDVAAATLRLAAPLESSVLDGLFHSVACTVISTRAGLPVGRIKAGTLATRVEVTPLDTPPSDPDLPLSDDLSITFYTSPRALRQARSEYVSSLFQMLATRAPGCTCDVFCRLVEPPIGATTLREALGRAKQKAPLNCLLLASVERSILKYLADGGVALAEAIAAGGACASERKVKKRSPPLSAEASAFFAARAAAWRRADRHGRTRLENEALEEGRDLVPGVTRLLVRHALKNRSTVRRPRD